MPYKIERSRFDVTWSEMEPIYRQHYGEMQERLRKAGTKVSDFNPRLDQYFEAAEGGWLLTYIVRSGETAVGYGNVYLTQDMHNSDLIAQEDAIYMLPEHRNGMGRKLVKHILAELKKMGVQRVLISPVTDLRVGKIWKRMGFQEIASQMVYNF